MRIFVSFCFLFWNIYFNGKNLKMVKVRKMRSRWGDDGDVREDTQEKGVREEGGKFSKGEWELVESES